MNIIEYCFLRGERAFEQCICDTFINSAGLFDYGRFFAATTRGVADHKQERYLYCLKILLQKILLERLTDGRVPPIREVSMLVRYSRYEGKKPFTEDMARQISDHLILHNPDIDFNERIGYAIQSIVSPNVSLFWHLLGKADLDHASVEADVLHTSGYTLLARCSKVVNVHRCKVNGELRSRRQANHIQHPCECSFDEAYIKLVRQAFELEDLQRSFDRGRSPLLEVIISSSQGWHRNIDTLLQEVNANLRIWLKVLLSAGVDLGNYGQQEHEYFRANDMLKITMKDLTRRFGYQRRLVSFQWGKTLDDWKFWWSTSMDEIENTFLLHCVVSSDDTTKTQECSLSVPGAWIETRDEQPNWGYEYEIRPRAESRRRRKRYLTAMGHNMRDAREVLGDCKFHGSFYRPDVLREDCLAYCSRYSLCRSNR